MSSSFPAPSIAGGGGGCIAGATLELTLHLSSVDGLRLKPPSAGTISATLLPKSKPFAVAWIDSVSKKSTKSLLNSPRGILDSGDPKLHFPLSVEAFGDPDAALTIQILTHRRRPLADRLEGSASIPLASLLNVIATSAGKVITLPLRRPSGRETGGWIRVSARVLWCFDEPAADCIVDGVPAIATGMPAAPDADMLEFFTVEPSAPPMPEDVCWVPADHAETESVVVEPVAPPPMPEDVRWVPAETDHVETESVVVEPGAPSLQCIGWMQEENCEDSSPEVGQSRATATNGDGSRRGDEGDHGGALGSFVVGFASGAALLAGGLYIIFARRLQHRF